MSKTIFAAGTVCWYETKTKKIKILLIRRVKHRDWSFPKGKVDKGESLPVTAVRETKEETGLNVNLAVNLGTITYRVGKEIEKTVQYWAAKLSRKTAKAHKFVPNDEVYKIKWVGLEKVNGLLTYPADRDLFSVFQTLVNDSSHDTYSVTLLRHAKASPQTPEMALDSDRPLSSRGLLQAETIAHTLAAFGSKKIFSSTAKRCLETVAPLSELSGLKVTPHEGLSQETWEAGEVAGLRELVADIVRARKSAIICSHLPVLPDIAREIAGATTTSPGKYLSETVSLPPAAFSIFHVSKQENRGIVGVETYPVKI